MPHLISHAKRVVIKIGSSLLVDQSTGTIRQKWLESLLEEVAQFNKNGKQVILVSSGAIALGRRELNFHPPLLIEEKQAAAAVGQIKLAHAYHAVLAKHAIKVAQILLTLGDSENKDRYLNAKNTLDTLLEAQVVPVINENDTVATDEIRYGDNDRLAASVAQMVNAEVLVLLSDIEGLYTKDPRIDSNAALVPFVTYLDETVMQMATDSLSAYGSGGMVTKLAAAKIAMDSGCKMVISAGKPFSPLSHIDKTEKKTWFLPTSMA